MSEMLQFCLVLFLFSSSVSFIITHKRSRNQRRDHIERKYYRIIYPEGLAHDSVMTFLQALGGLPHGMFSRSGIVFEVWGDRGGIHHRIGLPGGHAHVINQLRTAARGALIQEDEGLPIAPFTQAVEVGLSQMHVPLASGDPEGLAASLLTSVSMPGAGSVVALQWVLMPSDPKPPQLDAPRVPMIRAPKGGDFTTKLMSGVFNTTYAAGAMAANSVAQAKAHDPKKVAQKYNGPMFRGICRIGARSNDPTYARQLVDRTFNILQAANAAGVKFIRKGYGSPSKTIEWMERGSIPLMHFPVLLNANELSALAAFPMGTPAIPGLQLGGSHQTPPSADIPSTGRILAKSNFPGAERPLAMPWSETLRHMHTMGSTGSGKSVFLLNSIMQDIHHGVGVCVIDPKGDLIDEVIDRIPGGREQDVIILDPTDPTHVVGINLLAGNPAEADLITDNIVGMFHKLNQNSWGPRLERTLRAAVRTLACVPDMTMMEVAGLLLRDQFRQRILANLTIPYEVREFWERYDEQSPGERSQTLDPILNKLDAFMLRANVRDVIGQANPTLDMEDVLANRNVSTLKPS